MTGTSLLLRHHLRRDRLMILWWVLGGTLLYWAQAVSVDGLYSSQAEFDRAAASMEGNAAMIAMTGPARALNTVGGQVTWQATAFGAIVAGLMSMFLVGRHTRAEEESGRDELVRAAAVGRHAPMTAALLVALVANTILAVLVAFSLATYPLAVPDSVALGLGVGLCGMLIGAVALVAAQLTASTRTAYGLTGLVIGVAYALRAVGDVGNPALSWLSPIGWYQAMHPFSGLRWWPAALLAGGVLVVVRAAYAVFDRRDFGVGLVPARPGPVNAGPGLRSSLGLSWRLQRGTVLGWSAGLLLTGLAYGSLGTDVDELIGDSEATRELFAAGGADLTDGFYASAILQLALITGGFAIASALRPRGEEESGRVESLLATALPRRSWLLGHVAVTVAGVLAVLLASGAGLAVGYALVTGSTDRWTGQLLGPASYAPAVLALSALTRLIHGVRARWASLAWLGLVLSVVVVTFAEILRLPQWLRDVSPFEHLALVPVEGFAARPFALVLAVAVALSTVGQLRFARRDLT